MKLIPGWRRCVTLRTFSSAALAAVVAIQTTWATLPEEWRASVPSEWVIVLTIIVGALGFVGRFIDQGVGNGKAD